MDVVRSVARETSVPPLVMRLEPVADRNALFSHSSGTPEYLAPEIIQSKGHGKAVDWWALGILIFEMLAGYPPFYDENPFGIYQKVLKGAIDFPKHMDVQAKDLIKKLLTADRTKRFGCLQHGAEDIRRHPWFKNLDWDKVSSIERRQ
jgi:protein kinase X